MNTARQTMQTHVEENEKNIFILFMLNIIFKTYFRPVVVPNVENLLKTFHNEHILIP